MAVHIVTYDLRAPGKDYEPLLSAIRVYPNCHCLKSAFFIETNESAQAVRDKLMRLVDQNDQLYGRSPAIRQAINMNQKPKHAGNKVDNLSAH